MSEPQAFTSREAVDKLLDEARALDDLDGAMALYERALALDPERASTHYNIGLVHKYRGAWVESLYHNRRASDLRPDDEAANWNMGIAATALRDWTAAREAWHRVGLRIPEGDGPIQGNFGIAPVRLNPDDNGEVVWGTRIDPVRVVIRNIPYPKSGFRAGDVVLHDGAPVGERQSKGRTYSVFNVLELFEPSANSTYEAEVHTDDAADLEALTTALDLAQVDHEVWTSNVRILCRQCSEGVPHEHASDDVTPPPWPDIHVIGISTTEPAAARKVLMQWSSGRGGLLSRLVGSGDKNRLLRFECALAGRAFP
ncbi:tetratricopeptide repeat protein [Dyella sp. 333MFSha]|uniref:tetratricopeptide repeat protein n=1 Tax=Dyella sp. 333MFSha TaxID=1798240 RepID=UPI000B83E7E9|nr:tetratricopeptide repeat protein [Dyella sp. 333MFSha]